MTSILEWINGCAEQPYLLGSLLTANYSQELLRALPLTSLDELPAVFTTTGINYSEATFLSELFLERVVEEVAKKELKEHRRQQKITNGWANQAEYLPLPTFIFYPLNEETHESGLPRWRMRYTKPMRSRGLLERYINFKHGNQSASPAIGLIIKEDNELDTVEKEHQARMKAEMINLLNSQGFTVSGERLLWTENSPGYNFLTKLFPDAISAQAYWHGLNAPILPSGFIPQLTITFRQLVDENDNDLGTDGSGLYHPETPELQDFIKKYGLCPIQPRVLHEQGLFAKGVLFPSAKSVSSTGQPCVTMDWNVIKGRLKDKAKQNRAAGIVKDVPNCALGVINVWARPFKLTGCFEVLENVKTIPETKAIVTRLVEKAMKRLLVQGLEGLSYEVASKEPSVRLILEMIRAGEAVGLHIKPWSVPRIRELMHDRLAKSLYAIANGGGIRVPCKVARMDTRIPEGKVVVSGIPAGQRVVAFRFPIILAQGLLELETIEPHPDHLIDGTLPVNQIIMNPADVTAAQGDDDGDTFGVTTDPDLVELFKYKSSQVRRAVEPKGIPLLGKDGLPLATNSPEGKKYIAKDNRGPVGLATVFRATALAVGLENVADALSIGAQECIDQAKRIPEWTDIPAASDPNNWVPNEKGWLTCTIRYPKNMVANGWPVEAIQTWLEQQLIHKGCCEWGQNAKGEMTLKAKSPLWWRSSSKKVPLDNWYIPPSEEYEGFENLVHWATRETHRLWQEMGAEFTTTLPTTNLGMLFPALLEAKGHKVSVKAMTNDELIALYQKLGLTAFNRKWTSIKDLDSSDEESQENFVKPSQATLQYELEETLRKGFSDGSITLDDIATVWVNEMTPSQPGERPNNPNNAFRVICFEHSPILALLGISSDITCPFLFRGTKGDRIQYVVDKALLSADPYTAMYELMKNGKIHSQGTIKNGIVIEAPILDKEDKPVAFHECPDCLDILRTALVYKVREKQTQSKEDWMLEKQRTLSKEWNKFLASNVI